MQEHRNRNRSQSVQSAFVVAYEVTRQATGAGAGSGTMGGSFDHYTSCQKSRPSMQVSILLASRGTLIVNSTRQDNQAPIYMSVVKIEVYLFNPDAGGHESKPLRWKDALRLVLLYLTVTPANRPITLDDDG